MASFTIFDGLVWGGAALTLIGLGLLVLCIIRIFTARRKAGSEAELQSALRRLVALNLGAVALSGLGLMCVVVGIFLA